MLGRRWRRLRRSPQLFWVAAAGLALTSGMVVTRMVGAVEDRARELGGLVEVPVAAGELEVGAVLDGSDVVWERLPAALLPDSVPLEEIDGQVVSVPVVAGEVVTEAKVGGTGLSATAALIPSGRRALAVPIGAGLPPLERGDRVDVLATFEPAGEEGVEPTFPVAEGAGVVAVTDDVVTVAVDALDAPRVAYALAMATVTLALSGATP